MFYPIIYSGGGLGRRKQERERGGDGTCPTDMDEVCAYAVIDLNIRFFFSQSCRHILQAGRSCVAAISVCGCIEFGSVCSRHRQRRSSNHSARHREREGATSLPALSQKIRFFQNGHIHGLCDASLSRLDLN